MLAGGDLNVIIDQLEQFTIVHCKMTHEKVMYYNQQPQYKIVDNNIIFDRAKLCLGRAYNLGCAHTKANTNYSILLGQLEPYCGSHLEKLQYLKTRFEELILQIYQLDHERGDLEHNYALIDISKDNTIDTSEWLERIRDLESKHHGLTTALEELHVDVIHLVKQMN
ncbi:MAG: hypothetical protein AAF901_04340 [Bacteroidota bacterium]